MILLVVADLPVAAVHCTSRGKVLSTTAPAAEILESAPGLMAEIVALVVQTGGRGGSAQVTLPRREPARFRLVAVQDRNADVPGGCLVFLLRDADPDSAPTDRLAGLTPREREVAQHAASGLRSWEVAERLGCRERTVRAHLQSTYLKLGIKTRVELAKLISRTR